MNNIENQVDSTHMDDIDTGGPSEQDLLDAVMANSPIMEEAGVPLPDEEEIVEDPAYSEEEDPEEEEVVSEEDEEEVEEIPEEDADEESATEVSEDVYTADDLDLDVKVQVKIDGEDVEMTMGDLIKGATTDAHLSRKGRELGEAAKAFEEERNAQLAQVQQMGEASAAILYSAEQAKQKEYHALEEKITQARKDGDTYELNELKDKQEVTQKEYWAARRQREGLLNQINQQKEQAEMAQWQQQMEYFNQAIPELIPDFTEEVAGSIRQFAIDEGINPDLLDQITDPIIVKFVDDYRRLKQGVSKGAAKRKAAPAKKAVPTKKAKPAAKKTQDAQKMKKARAFREDATPEQQMDYLRDYAARSLNKL